MGSIDASLLFEAAIPVVLGIYATMLGYGVVGRKPGELATQTRGQRGRRMLRLLGPGLIAFGLIFPFLSEPPSRVDPNQPAVSWQRYFTADHLCSAELPAPPRPDVQHTSEGITHRGLLLQQDHDSVFFLLTSTDRSLSSRGESIEALLDSARESLPAVGDLIGSPITLVDEQHTSQDGVPGRELHYTSRNGQVIWIRIFVTEKQIVRLLAGAPQGVKESELRTFLDSVRFEKAGT